ncbi:MAG TPA: deoxyguanosinetriphosphate triphosphohydrolase [Planctomycetota bacterium]|nr:deoxyguanosinetriphosphate triphosphohydrolase [Planctomycetota bacterium]
MTPAARLYDRTAKEEREARELAPYAMRSAASKGRRFHEQADQLRTAWERDRDRIVHCTSFRRLMYKTQVFVNSEGDHYRTRLSHSLEVCQVARSIGAALALNEPFCEALSLAHDIGHPPFGHRGEWALNELMQDHGGFRHNVQVLRVVDRLERRSPDYPGLNLTRELRESLLKHERDEDWPAEFRPKPRRAFLEAQVVDLADSTAYDMHDLEDGLNARMFGEEELEEHVALWRGSREAVELRHPGFLAASRDRKLKIKRISNELIKISINDLIDASARRIAAAGIASAEEARAHERSLVGHSEELSREVAELQRFLDARFYKHPHLEELTQHASATLRALFEAYVARPQEMPPWYQKWAEEVGLPRAVCDYVAGMTDRFAEQEHARLAG